ncbi:MAG TPA: hypothetical protein VMT17_12090 [Anaeromyxobacteraceae bacterium]|nr:hypothetical protein [Anaeromyxobacteraceae bacterium]
MTDVNDAAAPNSLLRPHGGDLSERFASSIEADALVARAPSLPSVVVDPGERLDLELLASGGASPLRGFMGYADYRRVLDEWRLSNGLLMPLPLTLAVPIERLGMLCPGTEVALRAGDGSLLGALTVRDTFVRDLREEARLVYGTDDARHPGANALLARPAGAIGGEVVCLRPRGWLTETAREVRLRLAAHGFYRVGAGFGAGLPEAASALETSVDALLAQSLAGNVAIPPRLPVVVARLPLGARHAGAREAVFQCLVLRNFGVSHVVLGGVRTGLRTADALVRHRNELGLMFLQGTATAPLERLSIRAA